MSRAKAFFSVSAGLIPDQPMPEHSRQWGYTSQDYEADKQLAQHERTAFVIRRDEALAYARDSIDPAQVNWVELKFVWL